MGNQKKLSRMEIKRSNMKKILIRGPALSRSGYGEQTRFALRALRAHQDRFDIYLMPVGWGETGWIYEDTEERRWIDSLVAKTFHYSQSGGQYDISLQVTIPNEWEKLAPVNVGYTAGIETTICHSSWLEGCNKMNLNLVSSEHSKNVFLNSKYTHKDPQGNVVGELKLEKPIEVLLEGANLDLYKPTNEKPIISLNKIKEDFCYLFVGHWMQGEFGEDIKNVGLLIKSFYETFKNKKKTPALILKTSGAGCSYMD